MTLYIIINKTLNHHVTTQTTKEKADEFMNALLCSMDMEYTMHKVEVGND